VRVEIGSLEHTAFSVADSETCDKVIKVLNAHKTIVKTPVQATDATVRFVKELTLRQAYLIAIVSFSLFNFYDELAAEL